MSPACTRLGVGPSLLFDGDPISGRVCGVSGDALIVDGQRCLIERLELLDDGPAATDARAGDDARD